MQAFTTLTAVAVPLDLANVDTDQIVPARFLGLPRATQVEALFRDLRDKAADPGAAGDAKAQAAARAEAKAGVSKVGPQAFPLDDPAFAGARILVSGANFGCGSSRENAVTVLVDNGFRAFIAPSFGDIFFNNCYQNSALPIVLPPARVSALQAMLMARPGQTLTVDLPSQTVTGPDARVDHFTIDAFRKACLLEGTDEIGLTLGHREAIEAFEAQRRLSLPWM